MADVLIGLAEAIEGLRVELTRAMGMGAGKPMRLSLGSIDLTLQLAATNEGNGKVGWKVIELGGKRETVSTQTLTLKLTPQWRDIDGNLTTDFTIAGDSPADQQFGPTSTSTPEVNN